MYNKTGMILISLLSINIKCQQ